MQYDSPLSNYFGEDFARNDRGLSHTKAILQLSIVKWHDTNLMIARNSLPGFP